MCSYECHVVYSVDVSGDLVLFGSLVFVSVAVIGAIVSGYFCCVYFVVLWKGRFCILFGFVFWVLKY